MDERKPKPLGLTRKVKKITVKLNSNVKNQLPSRILEDGYNMRQKSLWVAEAVESLLSNKNWEGALLSEIVTVADAQDVYSFPSHLAAKMHSEALRVSMKNQSLNANQSTIIRAAINRRLLGFFQIHTK